MRVMKTSILLLGIAVTVCCSSCQETHRKIGVAWSPGYAYVPSCKPQVKYQGTSFEIQGVKIPVPQLGGTAEVGGVKIDPKVLNQAYQTTQILDTSYHSNCELLPSFSTDKAKFEAAVQEMRDSQVKLSQLALSIQTGKSTAETPSAPAANPLKVAEAPPDLAPAVMTGSSAGGPATPAAAKKKATREKLNKWVATYSKKTKKEVVKTRAKPNAALGLPPAKPSHKSKTDTADAAASSGGAR